MCPVLQPESLGKQSVVVGRGSIVKNNRNISIEHRLDTCIKSGLTSYLTALTSTRIYHLHLHLHPSES